ncbi:MAG: carboxypeptidase regulatory-like domain-containing protein [Desulfobacteraceae bacterium]|nr:carboxypeptidase regulatory-like domain-containing protein [Desulfobacteraceae bacterium]
MDNTIKGKDINISFSDISRKFEGRLKGADRDRLKGLGELSLTKRVKAAGLKQEKERLMEKLGPDDPRVEKIRNRERNEKFLSRNLAQEIQRAGTDVSGFEREAWNLFGHVRDRNGLGVPGLTVALFDENGNWIRKMGYGCTDKDGSFSIIYPSKGEEKRKIPDSPKVFIHVTDKDYRVLYKDSEPLYPLIGQMDYREIYLTKEEVCTPPEPGQEEPPAEPGRWIVKGRVADLDGRGIAAAKVSLYDKDLVFEERLGTTLTDDDGNFMASYEVEEFPDLFEAKPGIYLKVLDENGKLLYASKKKVKCRAGRIETFDIKAKRKAGR